MGLARKLNTGAGQAGPGKTPAQKQRQALVAKPTGVPQTPRMSSGGTLSTGEHPERDAYLKRRGLTKDPLEAQGARLTGTGVAKTGPRKGSVFSSFSMKGATYHVHYGPGGTRNVYRVSGPRKRPRGIGVSAYSGVYQR